MNDVTQFIIESTTAGLIDKKTGAELLKRALKLSQPESNKAIAVIGIAVKLPGANNLEEFWRNLQNGVDSVSEYPFSRRNDTDEVVIRYGNLPREEIVYRQGGYLGEIDKFDYKYFNLSPKEASLMDPHHRIFLETAMEALEDAGYGGAKLVGSKTGIYMGYNSGPVYGYYVSQVDRDSVALSVAGNIPALTAGRLAYYMNFKGPSILINTACSSTLVAVHQACQAIRNGDCDQAVVAGVKLELSPVQSLFYVGIDSSQSRTLTFDEQADGTTWGEGAIVILIKPLAKAVKDHDHIYAVIKGSAVNQDGASASITAPNSLAQAEVIMNAWKDAEIDPETISYIEAHGTGTRLGDPIEIDGIQKAFKKYTDKKQFCGVGSVKTNIGHLDSSAGLAGFLKAALALHHGYIPPTLHFNIPNRKINFERSPIFVTDRLVKWEKNSSPCRCGVSSFGFSGTNCHVVLEEAPEIIGNPSQASGSAPLILTISAKTNRALRELIIRYLTVLEQGSGINAADFCYTANTGKSHLNCRIALTAETAATMLDKIRILAANFESLEKIQVDGIYYGQHQVTKNEPAGKNGVTVETIKSLSQKADTQVKQLAASGKLGTELDGALEELCRLYVSGAEVHWDELYRNEVRNRISTPAYPFEKTRCWLEITETDSRAPDKTGWFYDIAWKPEDLVASPAGFAAGKFLIIKSRESNSRILEICDSLAKQGRQIIYVNVGKEFQKVSDHEYVVSGGWEDYRQLFSDIHPSNLRMIHLLTVNGAENTDSLDSLLEMQSKGVSSLVNLVKALNDSNSPSEAGLVIVGENTFEITSAESWLAPENAPLLTLGKFVNLEYPAIQCRCIDIDEITPSERLVLELISSSKDRQVAYRKGQRYLPELSSKDMAIPRRTGGGIKEDGVYIITGGTGGIGLEIGKYLARAATRSRVKLVLLNRSRFPDRREWNQLIARENDAKLIKKIKAMIEIETTGAAIDFYPVDIGAENDLREVLAEIRAKYGKIDGVIHCAGVVAQGRMIASQEESALRQVMAPKLQGTWLLDHLTRDDSLDFFIMFSSVSTIAGGVGGGDYVAANAYLDAYASYRNKYRPGTVVINWPMWNDTGMLERVSGIDETRQMFKVIAVDSAINAFERILQTDIHRVMVGRLNFKSPIFSLLDLLPFRLSPDLSVILPQITAKSSFAHSMKPSKPVQLTGGVEGRYSELERGLAEFWRDALGFEVIDIRASFVEMGGDSIYALKIVNGINETLRIETTVSELLTCDNIHDYAQLLQTRYLHHPADEPAPVTIPPAPAGETYRVSSAQKRIYILNQMDPGAVNYNLPRVTVIEGPLERARLEDAFCRLIQRHEVFRTSIVMVDEELRQRIAWEVNFKIQNIQAGEAEIPKIIADFIRPFDLSAAPLLRAALIKVHDSKRILIYDLHHIIADGISLNIMIQELIQLYQGEALPELKIQYKDFAEWQNRLLDSDRIKKQEEYWLNQFSGEIPILNLPFDFPRPAAQSFEGAWVLFEIGAELTGKINQLAVETGTTMYIVLLAAFNILLAKYTGQEDLIIGSPMVGRPHTQLEKLIGMFANTVALRNYPTSDRPFREFLAEVKGNSLRAFENQDYPFEELIEKLNIKEDLSRNPLFDVMFMLQTINQISETGGLRFIPYEYENQTAKFDLLLQAVEDQRGIHFNWEYCAKLFTKDTILRMAGHFTNLLTAITAQPGRLIKDLELVTAVEKQMILTAFNDTRAEYPKEKTIHELFTEQAERTPEFIAVVSEERRLTYDELNHRANQLGRRLRQKGVTPNQLVGIMVERSPEMLIGIMAILKAGGAYLPISPEYPAERINYMLQDGCVRILLTKRPLENKAAGATETVIYLEDDEWYTGDGSNPAPISNAGDLAYCIYTSGSTGNPKGVIIAHFSLVNRLNWMQRQFPINTSDVILQKTPYTFDVSLWELFWWSFTGAKVSLLTPGGEKDPEAIIAAIEKDSVTTMHFVPSMLNAFLEYIEGNMDLTRLRSLKQVFASGEALTVQQVQRFAKLSGADSPIKLYNLYGPTEATVDVSFFDCSTLGDRNTVPIGKPIDNIQMYIVDPDHHLQPVGVPGELCITGDGLARGYWGKPELTAQKFVPNPFYTMHNVEFIMHNEKHQRAMPSETREPKGFNYELCIMNYDLNSLMYKTGDLARWLPDGNIEFLGRIDFQVKIRGFRIELGEIEARILKHPAVKDAVVITKEGQDGDKRLCAYLVENREFPVQELRQYLANSLPDYMIPSFFVKLEQMPLTSNGKADRKALAASKWPETAGTIETKTVYAAPRNKTEARLVVIWRELLGIEKVGIDDNFFELGGHSLKAVILVSRIYKEWNMNLPLRKIFEAPTIRALATFLTAMKPGTYLSIQPAPKQEYYPVSFAQKRLFLISQHEGVHTSFNMFNAVIIEGALDIQRLTAAVQQLIKRHESFRTSIAMIRGEIRQRIEEEVGFSLDYQEWESNLPEPENARIEAEIRQFVQPFDLTANRLFRVKLIKLANQRYLLAYDMHHIISDGVSLTIFIKELIDFYFERQLPALPIQYKDFAVWQNEWLQSDPIKKQEEYWLNRFSGNLPALHLPTDFPRPSVKSYAGDSLRFTIEKTLQDQLQMLALKTETTLYMVLLAAYHILLYKYSGQGDLIIGSNVAGRTHPDLENIIGMFLNILPMRNQCQGDMAFSEFLAAVKQNTLEAFENQEYQFDMLVEKLNLHRDLSRNPLFDTVFTMQDFRDQEIKLHNIRMTPVEFAPKIARMDLMFIVSETNDGIQVTVEYSTQLFKRQRIERIPDHYLEILHQIIENIAIVMNDVQVTNRVLKASSTVLQTEASEFQF